MLGLLANRGSYSIDALLAWNPSAFGNIALEGFVPSRAYDLGVIQSGPCAVIGSGFLASLGYASTEALVASLRRRFDRVVFWDHADPFQLDLSAKDMARFDAVLKVNGLHVDRDLYNFRVGAPSPRGSWTDKSDPRPGEPYSSGILDRLRLAPPCFLSCVPEVRSRTRALYHSTSARFLKDSVDSITDHWLRARSGSMPKTTAHFAASLTHVQRRDTVKLIRRAGISMRGGITHVPPFVAGFGNEFGMQALDLAARHSVETELRAEGLFATSLSRPRYLTSMMDCKAVVSITGYGEVCFRMAEAWASGRVLVCQDMSHAEIAYPLVAGGNVVYCRPDLSNLCDILDDIECNWDRYKRIGEQGREDWLAWSRSAEQVVGVSLGQLRQ